MFPFVIFTILTIFSRMVHESGTGGVVSRVVRHDLGVPDEGELDDCEDEKRQKRKHQHTFHQDCAAAVATSATLPHPLQDMTNSIHLVEMSNNIAIHVPTAMATPNGTRHFSVDFGGSAAAPALRSYRQSKSDRT